MFLNHSSNVSERVKWLPQKKAFTLIELLVVIAIIGLLASIVTASFKGARESAYFTVTKGNLRNIALALELYNNDYGDYPPDENRDIPAELQPYFPANFWPPATWPESSYDWDNWEDPVTEEEIYQISVRFCPLGEPENCAFPNQEWAEEFDYYSSVYYCISGPCRAHISRPIDHPGYRVNYGE